MGDFSGFSHVIFDLDGVLLDTEPLYTRATEQVLVPFGKVFDWSVKSEMMGRDAMSSAQYLVNKLSLPISAEEYLQRKEPLLQDLFRNANAMPGAEALVGLLAGRGCKLAVATSSSTAHFELKTRRHAWFSQFEVVVCSDHPEVFNLKPAPDIFLVAAKELATEPHNCLVVEDSPAGVTAARAAGMQVLALADRNISKRAFVAATRIVYGYAELNLDD